MDVIQYNGKLFVFNKKSDEPPKFKTNRLFYLVKNMDKGYETAKNLSYIWMNHKYYNLDYDPEIMKMISN